jgi:uncharacterized protein
MAGARELRDQWPEAIAPIMAEAGQGSSNPEEYLAPTRDGSPTAYIFRCLHGGSFGGYSDCD